MKKLIKLLSLISTIGIYVACDVEHKLEQVDLRDCSTDGCVSQEQELISEPYVPSSEEPDLVNKPDPQFASMCSGNSYDICFTGGVVLTPHCNFCCSPSTGGCSQDNEDHPCRDPMCIYTASGSGIDILVPNGQCDNTGSGFSGCGGCRRWNPDLGVNMEGMWEEMGFTLISAGTCASANATAVCEYELHDCFDDTGVREAPDCTSLGSNGVPCVSGLTCGDMGFEVWCP